MWFWFFGLTILTGMHLVFRLTCITIPPLRCSTFLSIPINLFPGRCSFLEGPELSPTPTWQPVDRFSNTAHHFLSVDLLPSSYRNIRDAKRERAPFLSLNLKPLTQVLGHCYLGDWFVLYQLCKNSNSYFFRYLLRSLEKSFNAKVTASPLILITEWA